jgi:hypothetical protein
MRLIGFQDITVVYRAGEDKLNCSIVEQGAGYLGSMSVFGAATSS